MGPESLRDAEDIAHTQAQDLVHFEEVMDELGNTLHLYMHATYIEDIIRTVRGGMVVFRKGGGGKGYHNWYNWYLKTQASFQIRKLHATLIERHIYEGCGRALDHRGGRIVTLP